MLMEHPTSRSIHFLHGRARHFEIAACELW